MKNKTGGNKTSPQQFKEERERLNQKVLEMAGKNTKRFFNLDNAVYQEGSLPVSCWDWFLLQFYGVMIVSDIIWSNAIKTM